MSRVQFIADKTLFGKERSPQFILIVIKVNVYYQHKYIYIMYIEGDSFIKKHTLF